MAGSEDAGVWLGGRRRRISLGFWKRMIGRTKKSFYDDEATSMYILDTLYGRQRNGAY